MQNYPFEEKYDSLRERSIPPTTIANVHARIIYSFIAPSLDSTDDAKYLLYSIYVSFPSNKFNQIAEALIEKEGATLAHINEATIFLKEKKDLEVYQQVAEEFDLSDLPAILLVADVCRSDLLFEIDAAVAY